MQISWLSCRETIRNGRAANYDLEPGLENALSPAGDIQYCDRGHDLTGPRR